MDQTNAIEVKNIKKKFSVKYTTFYGGVAKSGTKQVLDGIDFSVKKGEVFGIIGNNGCGKSTLLKLLANIMGPDSGTISINGSIASILELGIGFDTEASGRENIRMKCMMYGLTKTEIDSCIDEIITFSELGEQIDFPLRTYSSGMIAKLAFSVLMNVNSDILLMDEVLSVGDANFNFKSKLAFQSMKKTGRSIIIASHNIKTIETLCDRVMWIADGTVKEIGSPLAVCSHYQTDSIDSLDNILRLAESGDAAAMNRLGMKYRDGKNIEKNLLKAEHYFTKAASLGFIDAQLNLADLLVKQGNKDKAIELYKKAAQSGNPLAITYLAQLDDVNEMNKKLLEELKTLSEGGNLRAMKMLADLLLNGTISQKDPEEAAKWYYECAKMHNGSAQYSYGICCRDGVGVEKDISEAIKWLELASDHGVMNARLELANIYRKGTGVQVDMNKAIEWYELAAKCGDAGSMLQLGLIYRDGTGVEADSLKADYWFKMYADYRLSIYETQLGDLLKQGYSGVPQKRCMMWYEDAASKGNVQAMLTTANCYKDGQILMPNLDKVHAMYVDSANRFNSSGLFELALIYLKGQNVETNKKKAIELLKKSAHMGNISAMSWLINLDEEPDCDHSNNKQFWIARLDEIGNLYARSLKIQN